MAETTREHRELALKLLYEGPMLSELKWRDSGIEPEESHGGIRRAVLVAQALADAEQHGYERGLADRDERCLQSDMQRTREKLAFERGRETERAEVVNYLRQPEHDAADLAHNIESGKHLPKEE